jgi:hypothetical protein
MGEYLSKTCCTDKGTLVTYENITSRINSPVNFEFQRIILEIPDNKQKVLEQLDECQTPDSKPKMIRRTISGITEIKTDSNFTRGLKRSLTLKGKENFLRKAKRRLSSIRFDSDETPRVKAEENAFRGRVSEFDDWHIDIPDGDIDCDLE